jgi:hypothetical protein
MLGGDGCKNWTACGAIFSPRAVIWDHSLRRLKIVKQLTRQIGSTGLQVK